MTTCSCSCSCKPSSDEVVAQTFKTMDYSKFKLLAENRPIDADHRAKAREKVCHLIGKYGMLSEFPLLVTTDFGILDGQARFEAAKCHNQPVYYVMTGKTLEELQECLAVGTQWKRDDKGQIFTRLGNSHYERFYALSVELKLPTTEMLRLWGRAGRYAYEVFEKGLMVFEEGDAAHIRTAHGYLVDFEAINPKINTTTFRTVVAKLPKIEYYLHSRMMEKLERLSMRLKPQPSVMETIQMLDTIYNDRCTSGTVTLTAAFQAHCKRAAYLEKGNV